MQLGKKMIGEALQIILTSDNTQEVSFWWIMQTAVTVSLWRSHPAFSWSPFSFNSRLWRIHKNSVYLQFLNPQNQIQGICWFSLPFTMQFAKDLIEFRICCCSSLIFFTETMPTVSLQFFAGCSLQIDVVLGYLADIWLLCSHTDGQGAQSDSKGAPHNI
jgi:hypothetical protein